MEEKRFAILIDADNISPKYIGYILDEISNYGVATYKRIYGDWTRSSAASWKDVLLEHSITPIQQYSYTTGKNATDSAMIIDAMDILYSNHVDGFCIASSDSDFTKLSSRLRESGKYVIGMGEKKTPKPFVSACNLFKYLEVLADAAAEASVKAQNATQAGTVEISGDESVSGKSMTDISVIRAALLKIINENADDVHGINMGDLGSRLIKRYPDFDVRNYGYSKFSKFLKHFDFIEIKPLGNSSSLWVTLRNKGELGDQSIISENENIENQEGIKNDGVVKKQRKNNRYKRRRPKK